MSGKPLKLKTTDRFDPDRMMFVFTHIPKSGGTSFHVALKALSGANYCHLVPGQNDPEDIDSFWGIGGHFDFESPSVTRSEKDRVYVTLVRNPIDRFVSFYRHVMARPYHHVAQANPAIMEMGPLEFAQELMKMGNREISNLQCKMVCGAGGGSAARAIQRIEQDYTICAPLANQQQTVNRIAALCGVNSIAVQRLNVAKSQIPVDLTDDLVGYLSEINAEDLTFYEYVEQNGVAASQSLDA